MSQAFASFFAALKASSAASRVTAGLVALAVLLAVGVSAVLSSKPHYSVLLSGLDDAASAAAMKALAEQGIPFEVSQPPGPFVVYVDEDRRAAALAAVYQSSAMVPLEEGIPADQGGVSSVFMSSGERSQISQKRLWGEMERILEALDFVDAARVQTSAAEPSPFAGAARKKRTCAVQLHVVDRMPLEDGEAETVVLLVSRGLDIDPADIVLSDQSGRLLHGGDEEKKERADADWLELKERYDRSLAEKANGALAAILGPHKARVEVDSLWSFDQSTTSQETVTKGALTSETKNATEKPLASAAVEAAGSSANIDFGVVNAAVTDLTASAAEADKAPPMLATTDEQRREYDPSRTRVETVRIAPTLTRLSVALFLDDSIGAEQVTALEGAVQAAVGYDAELREDVFRTVTLPFVLDAEPAAATDGALPGAEGEAATEEAPGESGEPSRLVELLLRRGVEIAVAVVFIALLLASLRSARRGEKAAKAAAATAKSDVHAELLAQAQVQELLSSDPERVGEILSQWARDELKAGAGS